VLSWLAIIFAGKTLIVLVVARLFGESLQTAWRTGIILGHGGEFSLMLLSASAASGIVADEFAGPLLVATGASMLVGSLMVRWAGLRV
jgi:CPA2 family monovalent cation:H+ antiporter-2